MAEMSVDWQTLWNVEALIFMMPISWDFSRCYGGWIDSFAGSNSVLVMFFCLERVIIFVT